MELVDIVDENNKLTGQVEERWVAYNKGLWRRTVSCWIMNEKGEVLLQKRTVNKLRNPNKWAKTGGQVDSGETVEESIFREVKEELGISLNESEFELHDVYKNKNYFMDIYVVKKDFSEEEIILDKNEVVDWKWMSQKEIEHFIETEKNGSLCWNQI